LKWNADIPHKRSVQKICEALMKECQPETGTADNYTAALLIVAANLFSINPFGDLSQEEVKDLACAASAGMAKKLHEILKEKVNAEDA
jgi:hypothetical protein